MNIEKRLKQDAARFSRLQPPADLRARLQASLDAVPPMDMPTVRAQRPVRRWFAPAVAVMTICMMLVFMSALPMGLGTEEQPGVLSHSEATPDDIEDFSVSSLPGDKSRSDDLTSGRDLPLDRIGMFSGLAFITGYLCVTELKGRPHLLVPALSALTLFLAIALMYMAGIF